MADAAGDTVTGAEIDMSRRAEILFNATIYALTQAVEDVFVHPENLGNWDWRIFSDSSYNDTNLLVALFDNGRFFYGVDYLQDTQLGEVLTGAFRKALINVALIDGNFYVLQNGHSVADCPSTRTGVVLDDVCFTLEQAGSGPVQEGEIGSWSVEMHSDQFDALTKTYGVDLGDIYQSAWSCETTTNVYENLDAMTTFGSVSAAMDPGSVNVAPCIWSLPVFKVDWSHTDDAGDSYWASPCAIYHNNMTASTQQIGATYLPDNLNAVFTSGFCRGNTGCANSVNSICS
ncbi:hypothetical protein QBC46DRAFT_274644 [Diplogelasinospora grovesii]|uniref:Uncharacterized protein n=1 Tax=Diplogelasinospora grovesii TaxID=303347 RepID=A0AAN6RZB6_9PEZI|nr:hypothetical protein QBC46DRAFT_274644 [Diplogelasinospora grovesii]